MPIETLVCDQCGAEDARNLTVDGLFCDECFNKYKIVHCDFCSSTNVKWSYPCNSFSAWETKGGSIDLAGHSIGGWAACDTCKQLVEEEKFTELAERAVVTQKEFVALYESLGREVDEEEINKLKEVNRLLLIDIYNSFTLNRTGPVEAYSPNELSKWR